MILVESCNHLQLKPDGLGVCLVYPGYARAAYSCLSIQNVYSILNSIDGIYCDLIFLGEESSLFLRRRLSEFDVVAFSITYENHLADAVKMLSSSGIPPLREGRDDSFPLLIAGGVGVSYNPVPFMPVFDAVYLGEAEARLEEIFSSMPYGKSAQLEYLDSFDNVVVSKNYSFEYSNSGLSAISGVEKRIYVSDAFASCSSHSCFLSGFSEFKNMYLIELTRGCSGMCRFCVVAYTGLPYRERSLSVVRRELEEASEVAGRVGLVGAAVTDYGSVDALRDIVVAYGVRAFFSSVKLPIKHEAIFGIVSMSGQRSVTIAPEAGNEALRFRMGKRINDELFFSTAEKFMDAGVRNLKLYFMVGFPGETEDDVISICSMVERFRRIVASRKRGGTLTVSVNAVVPKPFTPLQWYGVDLRKIKSRLSLLRRCIGKMGGVRLSIMGMREFYFQALISRGDENIGYAVCDSVLRKAPFKHSVSLKGIDPYEFLSMERNFDYLFPWSFIQGGIDRRSLWNIYRNLLF